MLTRAEILAMPAGRELDALVAEKIMGYERGDNGIYKTEEEYRFFTPSTNISAAWEVVMQLQKRGLFIYVETYRGSFAARVVRVPGPELGYSMERDEAPEAICKAALLAVMEGSQ